MVIDPNIEVDFQMQLPFPVNFIEQTIALKLEDSMTKENYQILAGFIGQTIKQLIVQNVSVAIHYPDALGNTDVEIMVDGADSALLTLAHADCVSLLEAPTSESSIDLLELIVDEVGITMKHVEFAEEYYGFIDN